MYINGGYNIMKENDIVIYKGQIGKIVTFDKAFKMVKPEIPLALDGGMNGVRGNYDKLLEKQKSSQISITISPDFCL